MLVKELIEQLKQCDPDDLIVLSEDEEGNGYYEMNYFWKGIYNKEERQAKIRKLTPELIKCGFTEADIGTGINCIVFK